MRKGKVWHGLAAVLLALSSQQPAHADWRKELGAFRIGMTEADLKALSPKDQQAIREVYGAALGMQVEIIASRDFPTLIDSLASSRIDYAVYTAAAYAAASQACDCVEPLAAPSSGGVPLSTVTILIASPDAAIGAAQPGKGVAVPGADSLSGFGVPLARYSPAGAPLTGAEQWLRIEPDAASALAAFEGGLADGLFAVIIDGSADGAGDLAASPLGKALDAGARPYKLVWQSEPLPFGPHAVRKNLPPEAKVLLLKMLEGLAVANPQVNDLLLPEGADGFQPVPQSSYGLAISAAKALAAASRKPGP